MSKAVLRCAFGVPFYIKRSKRIVLLGRFFVATKNIFQNRRRKFGSFANLTVLVAKGENITCLCRCERG